LKESAGLNLSSELRATLEAGMDRMAAGAEAIVCDLPAAAPGKYLDMSAEDGSYQVQERRGDVELREQRGFTAGYLAGKLWMLSDYFDDPAFGRAAAEVTRYCAILSSETEADIGFVSQYAPAMGYQLTGEDWMKEQALAGCDSLVENFNPALGVLMVWPPTGSTPDYVHDIPRQIYEWETYIDSAACGSVLWWARRFDPRYGEIIRSEQEAISALGLIQPDGRVYHLLGFDPATREPIEFHTAQGFDDHSRWTRAQGWGMNSSVFAYEATGERQFLDVAIKTCDYFLEEMIRGGDAVPFYDLDDPDIPDAPRDTCTTTLAANAMVRLMQEHPDLQSKYLAFVERAITDLFEHHVTSEGIVLHGCWGNMSGDARERVMPYGNIYLIETLYRLLKPGTDIWGIRPVR
jgi:unsaturated chondroitin disaccharide hydrolase